MKFYQTVDFYDQRLKAQAISVSIYDTEEGDLVGLKYFSNMEEAIEWGEAQVKS